VSSETMKAIVHDKFGPPLEVLHLKEAARPVPGEGEVLVRVHASSANPYDWHFIKAEPSLIRFSGESGLLKPKKPIPGGDLAGVIDAVGPGVSGFDVGDEVFAFQHGAFAEFVVVPQDRLSLKPKNLSFVEAATVPLGAVTALQGLRETGGIKPDHRVLIVGASGGVGIFAVQMAKMFGAHVTGVSSTKHLDLVRSLGADEVIDYTTTSFTEGSAIYDLVFVLGGKDSPMAIRRLMSKNGRMILANGDGGPILGPVGRILGAVLMGMFVSQTITTFTAEETGEALDEVRQMIEAGHVKTVVDSTYSLAEAGAAVALVEDGSPAGKVAIEIQS